MISKKEQKLSKYQHNIFTTLFMGYGSYGLNRRSVALAMPSMIEHGLSASDAGNYD